MERIAKALRQYWGFEGFLPLQAEAMQCIVSGKDSVVVLPTGGGKSLCFQAPAVVMPGMAVVVSPLISLMKDQVDGLKECGIAAERLDSSLPWDEQEAVLTRVRANKLKLLYLSPERIASDGFLAVLRKTKVSFLAIDEAHCVSMWGHDFRPEYRQLGMLKELLGGVTIGAYTATATEHVRRDITEQLKLDKPEMLTGSFDRPNLIYKVEPRKKILQQVCSVIDRHKGQSGVIYCIRRRDVDTLCEQLKEVSYRAAPYHAGMADAQRKRNQELFINEKVDIIVATVAFGMGIDKSNVRYVIHTGMPKSLEHYQQESGRAGRDGLEAQCVLFYSGGDYGTWKSLMKDIPQQAKEIAVAKLGNMYSYCTAGICRHRALVQYFGQDLPDGGCNACDICLGQFDQMKEALIISQKILSCVMRVEQRFGGNYVAQLLAGSRDKRIIENAHDKLSTYGLLEEYPTKVIRNWIEQLVGQGCAEKWGEYNVLRVTEKGREVLKGKHTPRILKLAVKKARVSKVVADSWEGVDERLFEKLRNVRSDIASKKRIPAYIVFGDAVLRDMARKKPMSTKAFLEVKGVGEKKCLQYCERFIKVIKKFHERH